jgi:hypothetical protein
MLVPMMHAAARSKGGLVAPAGRAFVTETVDGVVYYITETISGVVYYLTEAA